MSEESESLELFHVGVKGMKWGVRKKRDSSSESTSSKVSKTPEESLSFKNPKVRAAAAVGLAVTGIVTGAIIASHSSKKVVDLDDDISSKGAEAAKKILDEPTDIIYMSKAYNGFKTGSSLDKTGHKFISKGNTKHYLEIFEKYDIEEMPVGEFKKMSNGDVAAVLGDFMGRMDSAGRPITHAVVVPAKQAVGLDDMDAVIDKFGPELQKRYSEFIESERNL